MKPHNQKENRTFSHQNSIRMSRENLNRKRDPSDRVQRDTDEECIEAIEEKAIALNHPRDLKQLIDQISRARIVMLGESSHGTHEFYDWRRVISEWLITKHGFNFIAVEGDWPPCWELNKFVTNTINQAAPDILSHFNRWPTWMWANQDIVKLAQWMRTHNQTAAKEKQAGFFGLDVYSLFESIDAVLKQLEKMNPILARRARVKYSCFDPFQGDEKAYARSLIEFPEGCEQQALENLQDLLRLRLDKIKDRQHPLFDAEQNARIVVNAENYYRTMMHGEEDSWNVRDRHMIETLETLLDHSGPNSKAIVWAHNTHVGDYRATNMLAQGQINLGGLAREIWGEDQVALVGFGTYEGSVIASHAWDGPIQSLQVPPAKPGSYEAAFHEVAMSSGQSSFFLPWLNDPDTRSGALSEVRGHRAIGVVYQPEHERFGNYVPTRLSQRYDAFVYVDRTTALEPLAQPFDRGEIPETWPMGQ